MIVTPRGHAINEIEMCLHLAEYVDEDYCDNVSVASLKEALDALKQVGKRDKMTFAEPKMLPRGGNSYES